jgi:flagellin-like hook-associated protein FlgL
LTISLLQAQTKAINVSLTYDKTLKSGTDYTRTSGTATQGATITFNDNLSGAVKADYQVVNPVQSGRTITLDRAGTAAKVNVYQEMSYARTAAISSANASVPNINAGLATFTVTPTMAAKPATITVMAGAKALTAGHSYTATFDTNTGGLTISLLQAQTTHIDVSFTYDKQLSSGTDYTRTSGTEKTAAQITLNQTFSGDVKVSYEVSNTVATGDYTVASGGTSSAGSVTFNKALSGTVEATYSVNKTLWGDNTAIAQDAEKLNAAISKLRSQASSMAANLSVITTRQDWSAGMISNLQTGSDNLTLADMNEEGANMLALQTRQQLGIQALSLASQANQSIMRLFG